MKLKASGPKPGEQGGDCDPTKEKMGCNEGLRCGKSPEPNVCVDAKLCDFKDDSGIVEATCGAKALAASVMAAFAIASTM